VRSCRSPRVSFFSSRNARMRSPTIMFVFAIIPDAYPSHKRSTRTMMGVSRCGKRRRADVLSPLQKVQRH
jgi:hypothetical protein